MTNLKCELCGAEVLPSTSFCRRCGSVLAGANAPEPSEQPTAIFPENESATTQRLDPRPTGPDRGGLPASARSIAIGSSASRSARRKSVTVLAIIAFLAGILTVVAIVRLRRHSNVVTSVQVPSISGSRLSYPGAQSIVDMTNNDGSRTIQLETTDSLAQVEKWYQTNLRLTKTVRLTSTNVVMKNEKVTITLANADNKTVVLIKQLP